MAGRLALVFDDGYATDDTLVRPVLDGFDVPGCFAVVPDWLDRDGYLDADQARSLAADGHEVLAHGSRHRFLQRYSLVEPVCEGDTQAVVKSHVFPEKPGGVYRGDTVELTDGQRREVQTVAGTVRGDEHPVVQFDTPVGADFDPEHSVLRFTEEVVHEEVVDAATALSERGLDPSGFVFPYGAADMRAWALAREHYRTLPNVACRSLPNRQDTAPTDLRRYYLETTHLTDVEISDYLDAVASDGGLGVLAGHSEWESVTRDRLRHVLETAADRGVRVTTFQGLHDENWF